MSWRHVCQVLLYSQSLRQLPQQLSRPSTHDRAVPRTERHLQGLPEASRENGRVENVNVSLGGRCGVGWGATNGFLVDSELLQELRCLHDSYVMQ